MSEPLVKVAQQDGIAWLILNDPQHMNMLSLEMLQCLDRNLDAILATETVRCVVITGVGRAFCAGGDLKGFQDDLEDQSGERLMTRLKYAQGVLDKVEQMPMPVIAAINGYAIAGGLELALCCDMIIAADVAKIGDGHARYGIIPAGGASVRLPRKLSANRANYLLLTANLVSAKTLQEWGLVNDVVEAEALTSAAEELARSVVAHSPYSLRLIKRLARESTNVTPNVAAASELLAFSEYADSADLHEGLAAFSQKRSPVFHGR